MGLVLLIIAVSGTYITINVKKSLKDSANMTSEQILQETLKGFQVYLKTLSAPVDLLTRNAELQKVDETGLSEGEKDLAKIMVSAYKITEGAVRVSYSTEQKESLTAWVEIGEDGKKKTKSEYKSGVDHTKEEWYVNSIDRECVNTIFSYITGIYKDQETGKDIFTVSQSIERHDQLVGVVRMDVEADQLRNYVQDIKMMTKGFVVLADENGEIMVSDVNNIVTADTIKDTKLSSMILSNHDTAKAEEVIGSHDYDITIINEAVTGWSIVGLLDQKETSSALIGIVKSVLTIFAVGLVIALVGSIVLGKLLIKEIHKIQEAIKKVASGDFTETIDVVSKTELGMLQTDFNTMVQDIRALISNIGKKAEDLSEISAQITKSTGITKETVNQVSEAMSAVAIGAATQASSTQEANMEVEKLSNSLEEVKEQLETISKVSTQASSLSNNGMESMETVIEAAKRSKQTVQMTSGAIEQMLTSIEKISYISDVIAGITEQTNLLSLNASIEAARAGEMGKGFAVVADEIRGLADESKKSTDEIKQIIIEIAKHSVLVKNAMEENHSLQAEQQQAVGTTKDLFQQLMDRITELEQSMSAINQANIKMFENKASVVERMEDIASISEESAAATEEVDASTMQVQETIHQITTNTDSLNQIACELQESVEKFSLN